ncbi:dihydrolipoyl dehydrogenase family protein [Clostridium aminobutyricum]|uniref:FAD-dependent oxidoreductase n=1 Tax=Clostridium aminobutyricum TaxID=33953 RepID=A0A939D9J1_CLOAM|nr:FAD-dependent oxidoreductase [Clostridium aminobutyricum]MBN7773919.1 FAD-dependent oxidoreductase [Clostridium aminobutyricum]
MTRYDMVVVGSGAGLMVLEEALNQGLNCAIIEKAKFGGTCLTKGCIPSKMLVYPADFIREIERSNRIGIHTCRPEIDWDTISQNMWEQINFHQKIESNLLDMPNLNVYKGAGAFNGPDSMVIRYEDNRPDDIIYGDKFIIAVGARSFIPPFEGLEETGYVTSETFFGEKFPQKPWKSLTIIGGGAISMEFAHIFSSFGTKVTIVARSSLILNKEEEEIAEFVTKQFTSNGVDVLTDSSVLSVSKDQNLKYVTVENRLTKEKITVSCEEIFVASGVQSNADNLSLENTNIEVDERGWIRTNSYLETSQNNIWALGDINGKYQFRHKANHEALILSQNLFGSEKKEASYDVVPWTIFTHPQVAHVGMTEKEVKHKGIPYKAAKNYYSEVVGGIAMGYRKSDEDNGFIKMIIGQDKKILGVHIVGPQASILLQTFVYLMNEGYQCSKKAEDCAEKKGIEGLRMLCPQMGTYVPISDSMVIHPSLNELTAWVFEKFD